MPGDGITLKDLLNWFLVSSNNAQQYFSSKNKYYSCTVEIGYCGVDIKEYIDPDIEISLTYTASWGIESFEQITITIPTQIKLLNQTSYFAHSQPLDETNEILLQIERNAVFSELLEKKISDHDLHFGEHDG